jgi:hypothetical protein
MVAFAENGMLNLSVIERYKIVRGDLSLFISPFPSSVKAIFSYIKAILQPHPLFEKIKRSDRLVLAGRMAILHLFKIPTDWVSDKRIVNNRTAHGFLPKRLKRQPYKTSGHVNRAKRKHS